VIARLFCSLRDIFFFVVGKVVIRSIDDREVEDAISNVV